MANLAIIHIQNDLLNAQGANIDLSSFFLAYHTVDIVREIHVFSYYSAPIVQ